MNTPTHRTFGVEQEHFIFRADGAVPSHAEVDDLWRRMAKHGFRVNVAGKDGTIIAVARETAWGDLVLTSDACTHILEVVFPKMTSIATFRELYLETLGPVAEELAAVGMAFQFGGTLPVAPGLIHWRASDTDPCAERVRTFVARPSLAHPLFQAALPGCIAATQVSLGIPEEEAIGKLRDYYAYEYLVPLAFSTSYEFQGVCAPCVRLLSYPANFASGYPLVGIPTPIPRSLAEYRDRLARCNQRDYSFVAIRSAERLEFRSACSQEKVEDIIRLVQFRLAVDRLVSAGGRDSSSDEEIALRFEAACYGHWPTAAVGPPLSDEVSATLRPELREPAGSGKAC